MPATPVMYKPAGPLAEFVDALWVSEPDTRRLARERILPTGRMQLVINLGSTPSRAYDVAGSGLQRLLPPIVLCGAGSRYSVIGLPQDGTFIGASFRAGGAHPFIRRSLAVIANSVVPIEDIWHQDTRRLRHQLLDTADAASRLEIFEMFLARHLAASAHLHPAVAFALSAFEAAHVAPAIGSITREIGMSSRRFITLFAGQVGLPPKAFCRVTRFQRVIQRAHALEHVNWTALALEHGYFDQAHMVHEFTAFAGMNPAAYLQHHPVRPACASARSRRSVPDQLLTRIFPTMRRSSTALLAAVLSPAFPALRAQQPAPVPPATQQIAAAITALPEELRAGAAVLGYSTAGKLTSLRDGTNDMVCLAPDPAAKAFHSACYHRAMEPFMARGRALREQGVKGAQVDTVRFAEVKTGKVKMPTQPTMLYQIFGGTFDPETAKVTGGQWLYVTYIPFATSATTGISSKPSDKSPWLMFPGTPKAHIMFSVGM